MCDPDSCQAKWQAAFAALDDSERMAAVHAIAQYAVIPVVIDREWLSALTTESISADEFESFCRGLDLTDAFQQMVTSAWHNWCNT